MRVVKSGTSSDNTSEARICENIEVGNGEIKHWKEREEAMIRKCLSDLTRCLCTVGQHPMVSVSKAGSHRQALHMAPCRQHTQLEHA